MSECVLRMELPKNCLDCYLHQIVYGVYKRANGKYGDSEILAVAMEFYGAPIIVPAERSDV